MIAMKLPLAGLVLLLASAAAGAAESRACGTYSADVLASTYAGYSDCRLHDAGEKPLWRGLTKPRLKQQVRLVFTNGHFAYTRVINIEQRADGSGVIRLRTLRHDADVGVVVASRRTRRVTAEDFATLNQLADASGVWAHAVGSWDGDEIFMHCQTLDMERVTAEGYRFSSVNIGCNKPEKLMPLIQFVTGLIGLEPSADGRLY
jgi:hypothetical protein